MFHKDLDQLSQLKSPALSDAQELFALIDANRSRLRTWLPWLDLNTKVEDSANFIEYSLQNEKDRKGITALIWHQGKIVGVAGQHLVDRDNKKVALGYWIAKEYEGKGLVTRATEVLTDFSIREDQLHRVEIMVEPSNKRSWAVPERLGFQFEGVARESAWLYDHFVDHRVYSMLSSDWLKRARARP